MLFSENIHLTKTGLVFSDKNGNKLSWSGALHKACSRILNWCQDFELFILHMISFHVPFHSVRIFFYKMAGLKIGKGSTIHMGVKFFQPKGITIGNDSIIGDRSFLDGRSSLTIGNHVDIASEVLIYNSEHDIESETFAPISAKVIIDDYVFIGPRAILLPGIHLGKGSIVAAGAVLTSDVKNNEIVGGVPAKVIGERKIKNYKYVLGRVRLFQ